MNRTPKLSINHNAYTSRPTGKPHVRKLPSGKWGMANYATVLTVQEFGDLKAARIKL